MRTARFLLLAILTLPLLGCQPDSTAILQPADTLPATTVVSDTSYALRAIPTNRDSAIVRAYLDSLAGRVTMGDSICSYAVRVSLCCMPAFEVHGCGIGLHRVENRRGNVLDSASPPNGSIYLVGRWYAQSNFGNQHDTIQSDGSTPLDMTQGSWVASGSLTLLTMNPMLRNPH